MLWAASRTEAVILSIKFDLARMGQSALAQGINRLAKSLAIRTRHQPADPPRYRGLPRLASRCMRM